MLAFLSVSTLGYSQFAHVHSPCMFVLVMFVVVQPSVTQVTQVTQGEKARCLSRMKPPTSFGRFPCSPTSEAAFSVPTPSQPLKITYLFCNLHPLLVHLQLNVPQIATLWSTSTTGSRAIPILIHVYYNLRSAFFGTTSLLLRLIIQQVVVLLHLQILFPTTRYQKAKSRTRKSDDRLRSHPCPTPSSVNAKSEQ